jgi:hypothetical protein
MSKHRIVELQKSVRIAREALTKIKLTSYDGKTVATADEALTEMWKLESKQQLQGLLGHDGRR